MPIGELLAPVSEESPGGLDLYDDPERQQIEQAFEEDPSGVDWRDIVSRIEAQSQRTKDLWLAVYLARAGARMGRLDVVVTGCEMLAGLLESYWAVLHPSIEEYGLQGRKAPCESLTRIGTFLGPLKRIALIEHARLGDYSAEDLERFEVEGEGAEGFGMFRHAVDEMSVEALAEAMVSLRAMRSAIERADMALMVHAEGDTGTDFKPTYHTIDNMLRWLAPYAVIPEEETPDAVDGRNNSDTTFSAVRSPGRVESREDVAKSIDAIIEYYARREPASPIPVALRRVRGWITMDFLAILRDIAPGGMHEAGSVLLARPEEENSGY